MTPRPAKNAGTRFDTLRRVRRDARPGDVAIFYRTNAQSRVFEEIFIRHGMPYKVVGGVSEVVPVDLHIPGCPPAPTAMLQGLLALLEQADAGAVTS